MPPSVETTKATAAGLAVDEEREIEFLLDRRAVFDIEPVDLLAGGAGLHGDKRLAEHLRGVGGGLLAASGRAARRPRRRLQPP